MKKRLSTVLFLAVACSVGVHAATTAAWKLEEGTGSTTTEEAVSGTLSDALSTHLTWSTDTPGTGSSASLSFDGTEGTGGAYIGTNLTGADIGIAGAGPKTIAGWIKSSDTGYRWIWGWSPTGGSGQGRDLRLCTQDGYLRFEVSSGYRKLDTGPTVTDGAWHFVAVIIGTGGDYTLGNVKFYIDGTIYSPGGNNPDVVINTDGTNAAFPGYGAEEIYVGVAGNVFTGCWNGQLDHFTVYDTALDETDLDYLYANPGLLLPVPVASNPNPKKAQVDAPITTQLSWTAPGTYENATYNIYFGTTEPNDLLSNYGLTLLNPAGRITATTIDPSPSGVLENLTTYYWVVDSYEPNEPADILHKGDKWFFTTITAQAEILTNPVSQTVPAGTTVELTVNGINITTYQWYKNGTPLSDSGNISGAATDTLTIANIQLANEGLYYCEANNELQIPDTSAAVRLMTRRLVAHWTLDGTLAAEESNPVENWDGVYMDPNTNGPIPVPTPVEYVTGADGQTGSAVKFPGTSIVLIPDSNDFFNFHPQGLTLTAWVLGPAGGDWRRFVNKGGSYAAAQHNSGTIQMIVEGGAWTTAVPAAEAFESKWRFVALTYDPDTDQRTVYGVYDDYNTMDFLHTVINSQTAVNSELTDLLIGGASETNSTYNYPGSVDDVRIYNYPLTASEIAAVYAEMNAQNVCVTYSFYDVAGPNGVGDEFRDCRVNLYDFVPFATEWLDCGLAPNCPQ